MLDYVLKINFLMRFTASSVAFQLYIGKLIWIYFFSLLSWTFSNPGIFLANALSPAGK